MDQNILLIIAVIAALRGVFLFESHLGLVGDESYYWDWSRQPAWCYYSKPPMVAWLIGLSTWLFGDSATAVRAPVLLLGGLFLWFYHATAKAFYGQRAATLAILLILATPHNVVANLIMTIDPPLFCFWMATLYFLQQALFKANTWAWFWAGCATAIALLSKQVAALLPLMLLVYILLDKQRYIWLKREYWLYLLPVLLSLIPILWWNQQHEWIMWSHSKNHFTAQPSSTALFALKYAKNLFLYQVLLISPVIFGLVLKLSVQNLKSFKSLNPQTQFLMLTGPILLVVVLLLSFVQKVQGNWPMPFYFSGLILLAGTWVQGQWRNWLRYGLVLSYVMVLITYSLPSVIHALNWQDSKQDPTRRFRHWQQVADNVERVREAAIPDYANTMIIVMGHRDLVSELAFYLPDHPRVYRYSKEGVSSQYEIWPGPVSYSNANAMLISNSTEQPPAEVVNAFKSFHFVTDVANTKNPQYPYHIYYAEGLGQWPETGGEVSLED